MKKYSCIYHSPTGQTVMEVQASDAEQALRHALKKAPQKDADHIEIWDETGLVQSRRRKVDAKTAPH